MKVARKYWERYQSTWLRRPRKSSGDRLPNLSASLPSRRSGRSSLYGTGRGDRIGEAFAIMKAIVQGTMPQAVSCAVAVLALAWPCTGRWPGTTQAGWSLIGDHGLDAWRTTAADWLVAGDAASIPNIPTGRLPSRAPARL